MSYPPPGNQPDPYQPGQPYDPTAAPPPPYSDPYSSPPVSGTPTSGSPTSGSPYEQPSYGQPAPYGQQPPVYGQPTYGQAAQPDPYGQQPYSGAPYGGGGYAPATPGTNLMAILSLVFAFVFAPAGIVLGHIAKKQLRTSGEGGGGLATAGMILGYVFTGLALLLCCGSFFLSLANS